MRVSIYDSIQWISHIMLKKRHIQKNTFCVISFMQSSKMGEASLWCWKSHKGYSWQGEVTERRNEGTFNGQGGIVPFLDLGDEYVVGHFVKSHQAVQLWCGGFSKYILWQKVEKKSLLVTGKQNPPLTGLPDWQKGNHVRCDVSCLHWEMWQGLLWYPWEQMDKHAWETV